MPCEDPPELTCGACRKAAALRIKMLGVERVERVERVEPQEHAVR